MLGLALSACRPDGAPATHPFGGYAYDVPLDPGSPWPKFRRTSTQDGRGVYGAADATDAEPWVFSTGKGIFSSPVIGGDGTVYVGSADRALYAITPRGTERWRFETDEIIDSAALLDDAGRLFVGSGDGHLYALDAETGTELWRFAADEPEEGRAFLRWFEGNVALAPSGDLLVPNDNFFVYSIDRETGAVRWRFAMQDQTWSSPAVDAATGTVYLGNNNLLPVGGNTYAIDAATGGQLWSRLDAVGSVAASPILVGDRLVVGAFDGSIRAHDLSTGAIAWEVPTRDHVYASAAALSDGTLIVPGADGTVRALDPETGVVRWAFDTPEPVRSSPAVGSDDTIAFGGGDGRLYVLDPDGTLRWSIRLVDGDRNDLNASPALGPDGIVIAGESGEVFSVPYDWCLRADDARCATGGETLPPQGTFLWRTSRWGTTSPADEGAGALGPAEPVALSLVARESGDTVLALLDEPVVTTVPPVDLDVAISANRQFLVVSPPPSGWGTEHVRISVAAATQVDPEREGLAFGEGAPGDDLDVTLDFDVQRGELAQVAPGDTWELWRLAAPLPTILPSYNQIGFDSLHYRVTVVETDGVRGLGWIEGALPGGAPDPATRTLFPVALTVAGGGLHLDADAGMTLEAMGAVLSFSDFRVTAPLDRTGSAPGGATLVVSAVCGDIPLYGAFLRTLGFCHPDSDALHVFGGALLDRRPPTAPVEVGPVTFSWEGGTVRADVTGLDPAAHRYAVVVVGPDGLASPLDYGTGTRVDAGGVSIEADAVAPGSRASLLADGVLVASGPL